MFHRIWQKKIVRFLCVGTINTLLDLTILNSIVLVIGLPVVFANLISASISISVSYFLYHRYVFKSTEPYSVRLFLHFFLVTGLGILVIQSLVIGLVTHGLGTKDIGVNHLIGMIGIPPLKVKFINLNIAKLSAVAVGMVWNYCLYHFVIFKAHSKTTEDSKLTS